MNQRGRTTRGAAESGNPQTCRPPHRASVHEFAACPTLRVAFDFSKQAEVCRPAPARPGPRRLPGGHLGLSYWSFSFPGCQSVSLTPRPRSLGYLFFSGRCRRRLRSAVGRAAGRPGRQRPRRGQRRSHRARRSRREAYPALRRRLGHNHDRRPPLSGVLHLRGVPSEPLKEKKLKRKSSRGP